MSWEGAFAKFTTLTEPFASATLRTPIGKAGQNLERQRVADLMRLLAKERAQAAVSRATEACSLKDT